MGVTVTRINHFSKPAGATPAGELGQKKEEGQIVQSPKNDKRKDVFVKSEKGEPVGYAPIKRLNREQVEDIREQRATEMKKLIADMLGKQSAQAKLAKEYPAADKDWMAQFLGPNDTPETAAKAIADDGEWGVNAVATRLIDMAVALSGGDTEKIALLRGAVQEGFKAAGAVLGGTLPDVCQRTYAETMKRFDYWEQNGSLDGYAMT